MTLPWNQTNYYHVSYQSWTVYFRVMIHTVPTIMCCAFDHVVIHVLSTFCRYW